MRSGVAFTTVPRSTLRRPMMRATASDAGCHRSSARGADWMTRPDSYTTIRSASRYASVKSWVTTTAGVPHPVSVSRSSSRSVRRSGASSADSGPPSSRGAGGVAVAHDDPPRVRPDQACQALERQRLARARGAEEPHDGLLGGPTHVEREPWIPLDDLDGDHA